MTFDNQEIMQFIKYAVIFISILVILLISSIFIIQYKNKRKETYKLKYRNHYSKIIRSALKGKIHKTEIPKNMVSEFLLLWNTEYNGQTDEGKLKLKELFQVNGLVEMCSVYIGEEYLKKKVSNIHELMLKIHTIGNIYEKNNNEDILIPLKEVIRNNPYDLLAFEATLAIAKINLRESFELVLNEVITRKFWGVTEHQYLANIFDTNVIDLIENEINNSIHSKEETKIISFLSLTKYFKNYSHFIIYNYKKYNMESVCEAIRAIKTKVEAIEAFNVLKGDSRWEVRVNLINLLSNFKHSPESKIIDYLIKCLESKNWWLRNRAATAIVKILINYPTKIQQIIDAVSDSYGKEAMILAVNINSNSNSNSKEIKERSIND